MNHRIIVNGASGKMGRLACQTIQDHQSLELAAGLNRGDDLERAIIETEANIVLDLTRADSVYANSLTIIRAGAHPVIGTSGLSDEAFQHLKQLCDEKALGGIIVPNFSISAVLMMQFAASAARFLPDVEIIEMHHQQKFDAPSGTAIKTADMIATVIRDVQKPPNQQESLPGARGTTKHGIHIHSLRLPGVLAKQQVIFGNTGETLSIIHDSIDRSSFMPGVILSCERVTQLGTLYYGLEHLLD